MKIKTILSIFLLLQLVSCSGGGNSDGSSNSDTNSGTSEPIRFFCEKNDSCPELLVTSDPHATLGEMPSTFRGYGDPSLAFDETSNTVWMTYSWLDLLDNPGLPLHINLGVRTHLAKSTDAGNTFEYVSEVNSTMPIPHPDTAEDGWLVNEVPTLVQQANGNWQTLWFQYFSPVPVNPGTQTERSDFLFVQSIATSPDLLGLLSNTNAASDFTSASFGSFFNLNNVQNTSGEEPLSDCTAFTEPELFTFGNETYLIGQCIVLSRGMRDPGAERLFLLRQDGATYTYIAELTNSSDAQQFGADVLTQPDVSFARDGSIILTMTPKILDADPKHQGCVVVTFDDFLSGTLLRTTNNSLVERAIITAEGNGLGPGLCTYDPNSNTGVLLVITTFDTTGVEFSLRRTGIHP